MPFSSAIPAASARDTSGTTPTAMITTSAGRTSPASVTTPVTRPDWPLIPAAEAGSRKRTPFASCSERKKPPSSGPIAAPSGTSSSPSSVTEFP